ncbi:hypothetical protein [Roseivivax sp. CAU 1761]
MKVVTLLQAAALAVLTVFGAHAAGLTPAKTAADPACLALSQDRCAQPSRQTGLPNTALPNTALPRDSTAQVH